MTTILSQQPDLSNAGALLDFALGYARRGWSIIPVREKKPAGLWKPFQTVAADPDMLRRLFARADVDGLAVITGAVSGGLAVRDFDVEESYHRWADAHPDDAARLPTVRTARGHHVYGTLVSERYLDLGNGELRADSRHYVVLPPSRHPIGDLYRWVNPLPPIGTPLSVLPDALTHADSGQTQASPRQIHADTLHAPAQTIDALILRVLPTGPGQRNRRLFDLARGLIGILGRDADRRELRRIVQDWHRGALPNIRTKPFDETWADFITAWERVKRPAGASLRAAVQAADAAPAPEAAAIYDTAPLRRLTALCAKLAAQWGDRPFPLGCRTAAGILGITPSAAHRLLATLQFDRIIVRAFKGTKASGRASEWHYLGGQP